MYGRGGEGASGKGRVLTMNLRQTSLACRPAVCHLQPRLSSQAGQEEWEGSEGGRRVGMRERARERKDQTIVPFWAPASTPYQPGPGNQRQTARPPLRTR